MKRMMIVVAMVLVIGAGLAWGERETMTTVPRTMPEGVEMTMEGPQLKLPSRYEIEKDTIFFQAPATETNSIQWEEIEEALRLADIIASRSLVCVEAKDAEKIRKAYEKVKEFTEAWGGKP